MKGYIILLSAAALLVGCTNSAQPIAQSNNAIPSNTPDRSQTAIAHGPQSQQPAAPSNSGSAGRWSASGDPIDTKELDAAVMAAEKNLSAKPSDDMAKKNLGSAFFKRAVALTEARQYASALGDYRRTLKYDPNKAEAKEWIEKITMIYGSLNKQAPREGEEPPPLPFEPKKS